ncbi:lysine transporter LysE [Streptomyces sp. SGAir0957]
MTVGRAAKRVGEFVVDTVGEVVGEAILTLLACAVLAGLTFLAYLSWSSSPRLTVAGAGLICLVLAHGAWQIFRKPRKGRRGLAAVTATAFTLAAGTAVFLFFYAGNCGCL